MNYKNLGAIIMLCMMGASCSELPEAGPDHANIVNNATTAIINRPGEVTFDYVLVDLNQNVVTNTFDIDAGSFYKTFGSRKGPAPEILVGLGDMVQLTIFESKSGGLFIPADSGTRPGNYVSLPAQSVAHDGMISVPYAGQIQAAGRSIPQIQDDIEAKLANRAIEPKVIASLTEQSATSVSVVGEINTPRKIKISQSGERILDMISMAGGIKYPGYETFVTLQRKKKKATIYFNSLITHPDENIYIAPGDTIYVYREPRRFVAFGAVGVATGIGSSSALSGLSSQFSFDQERVSLAEGVGKAGGLLDDRANPGQVFVYRMELRSALLAMGVDLHKFPPNLDAIPTIYRANFRDPSSYFFAQQFPIRHKDVLYASNAESVEITKFLNFSRSVTSTIGGVVQDAATVRHGARYISNGTAPSL